MSDKKDTKTSSDSTGGVKELFDVGAHYGYSRSRRHPSSKPFIFGTKNTVEIFDLEKTKEKMEDALNFISEVSKKEGQILFVSGKSVAKKALVEAANSVKMPYAVGRWIGGTLTNFDQIRKRVERLEDLKEKRDKGVLDKYTKHERMLIDREIQELEDRFGGISIMEKLPKALCVIDPKEENVSVMEAKKLDIPVVALASSDCDLSVVDYPVPANDSNIRSIEFFLERVVNAYKKVKVKA